jgi:crotonobetainyl-CoA:carnitine CoA-transferase CaiB-like acyl-CoA transferase
MSRVFAGPWAGQILADFGAEVVKVEHPDGGDDVRRMGMPQRDATGMPTGDTSSFLAMNRGKRSIAIDIRRPGGQAVLRALAAKADILIENFKTGDLKRYGLDFPALSAVNPRLIYCSITGFGQDGPYAKLPGYDPIFQAMSGLLSITGMGPSSPGAGPAIVGYSVADINAGFYAALAILAALHHRDNGAGRGQHIDLALLDAQVAAQSHIAMNYLVSGIMPVRAGTASQINTPWQAFATADGALMIAVGNDRQFAALCRVLGLADMAADPRFATNQQRITHTASLLGPLTRAFLGRTTKEWQDALNAAGVPSGPLNDFGAMAEDPQIRHRNMLRNMPHPRTGTMPFVANPIRFSETPISYDRAPPALGDHAREVLAEWLGLEGDQLDTTLATLERLDTPKSPA